MSILRQVWTDEETPEEVPMTATYIVELRNRIEQTCQLARDSLEKSSSRYARHFNKKAVARTFKMGARVLLLLPRKHNKLQLQWQGPFEVMAGVGEADYGIVVRGKARLYHANLLRWYVERETPARQELGTVAVVMEESAVETRQETVPTCQLEASEDHTKVNFGPDLNQAQRKELLETGRSATRILTDLPLRTQLEEFSFDLLEKEPVRTKQYPLPHNQVQVVKKEVAWRIC